MVNEFKLCSELKCVWIIQRDPCSLLPSIHRFHVILQSHQILLQEFRGLDLHGGGIVHGPLERLLIVVIIALKMKNFVQMIIKQRDNLVT